MAVIRSAEAQTMARDAIVLDLGELSRQGEVILAQAKLHAQRVIEEAQAERARLLSDAEKVGRERGEQKGFAEGLAKGEKQGAEEAREQIGQDLQRLAVAWGDALEHFETVRVALFREARLDVLKLAVAIAEKVAKKAIEADENAAAAQLEAALEMISRPTRLRIACSPADKQLLTDLMPALNARFEKVASAEVAEDAALGRGSVVVRTEKGEIDARIETQIGRVIDAILPDRNATAMPTNPSPPEPPPAEDEPEASEG